MSDGGSTTKCTSSDLSPYRHFLHNVTTPLRHCQRKQYMFGKRIVKYILLNKFYTVHKCHNGGRRESSMWTAATWYWIPRQYLTLSITPAIEDKLNVCLHWKCNASTCFPPISWVSVDCHSQDSPNSCFPSSTVSDPVAGTFVSNHCFNLLLDVNYIALLGIQVEKPADTLYWWSIGCKSLVRGKDACFMAFISNQPPLSNSGRSWPIHYLHQLQI